MEDTQCGESCPFVKIGFCDKCSECPNFLESWWTEQGSASPKIVKDCAPKRLLLQQQYLQLRLEQMTADLCESRAEYNKVATHLMEIIDMSKRESKKIESQNQNLPSLELNVD